MANYPMYNYQQPMYPQVAQSSWQAQPQVDRNNVAPMPNYQPLPYQPQVQIPQPQMVQQQATVPTVRGRVVTREEEIVPNEISMDGQISLFPLADYSCIIAKLWDSNGQIQTFRFVPLVESTVEEDIEDKGDMILGRLDEIELLLKKNSSQRYKKNQNGSRNEEKEVNNA